MSKPTINHFVICCDDWLSYDFH